MAGWTLKADDLSRARLCLARDLPCSSEEKQIRFAHPKGGFALIRGCFFSYVHTYPDSFLFRVSLFLSLIQNPPIRTPKLFPSPHENHHFDSKNTSSPPEKPHLKLKTRQIISIFMFTHQNPSSKFHQN